MPQDIGNRRGAVFPVRMTDDERKRLTSLMNEGKGPRALGPFLLWRALGNTSPAGYYPSRSGITQAQVIPARVTPAPVPVRSRVILDLCSGTGAWSEPYKRAGYRVVRVTLPRHDVRTFVYKGAPVWGVLAAPPCNEFSRAKRGKRDFVAGMACVNACLRIVQQVNPVFWALENPVGKLALWLGRPQDTFEPCDFGDPWTKATALWGKFTPPVRGPHVRPASGKVRLEIKSAERARTPAGFARAFFKANP